MLPVFWESKSKINFRSEFVFKREHIQCYLIKKKDRREELFVQLDLELEMTDVWKVTESLLMFHLMLVGQHFYACLVH